jgi:hypothetical protein
MNGREGILCRATSAPLRDGGVVASQPAVSHHPSSPESCTPDSFCAKTSLPTTCFACLCHSTLHRALHCLLRAACEQEGTWHDRQHIIQSLYNHFATLATRFCKAAILVLYSIALHIQYSTVGPGTPASHQHSGYGCLLLGGLRSCWCAAFHSVSLMSSIEWCLS